ncbi:MAG: PSD1 and planctomycete cytochrome C domain-containing protein [Verrucomicrobiia bacterium]|jgi:mono/diheme cytochrome c family protein
MKCSALFWMLIVAAQIVAIAADVSPKHARDMARGLEVFKRTVGPALKEHCLECHGGDKTRADFDISSREGLVKGYTDGSVIVSGKAEESLIVKLIRHEEDPPMPHKADKLSEELISKIVEWIDLGAPYDKPLIDKSAPTTGNGPMQITDKDRAFWSFQPLRAPAPPVAKNDSWIQSPIDRFVAAKLEAKGLKPNPVVGRRVLIRRAYLDLVGMPPSPEEVDAFVNDARPNAYEEVIDRLLKDPRYGERWARHWLDAARFAESHGFEQDYNRPFAYHYRDFVIKALNGDMPYDQFVRWQLAGDEFAPDDPLALMATGFLGAGVFPTQLTEKEFESARYDELDDMTGTMGTAMLGLTIGCARCHDHKFDPIPTRDYYRLLSTFTTTIRSEIELDLNPEIYVKEKGAWEKALKSLNAARDKIESGATRVAFADWLKTGAKAAKLDSPWQTLELDSVKSSGGAKLTKLEDGSLLAGGKKPKQETYTFTSTIVARDIRAIRLEALSHASLPRKGPGRAANGNFALSDFRVMVRPLTDAKAELQVAKLTNARATHEQNKGSLSVASSIDGDAKKTGWAVDMGGIGKDQASVFEFTKPIGFEGGTLVQIDMRFNINTEHSLGRLRLSVTSKEDAPVAVGPGVSPTLSEAMALAQSGSSEDLTEKQSRSLFRWFAQRDENWTASNEAVQRHLAEEPQPKLTQVQVTSEGLKPTKHHADGRGFPHFYPKTYFLNRGDVNQKQDEASSGFLRVLMRKGADEKRWKAEPAKDWRTSYRRRSLANWITDTEQGGGELLARVIANRLWHHHFGRGIVSTPNDFGFQGERPTHPELLDFLATELIDGGWRLKTLHKQIMLSATYRQSSEFDPARAEIDPENRWLWRRVPRRLEAEALRDSMLFVSGVLEDRMYGPGTLSEASNRRSIYFMIKRSKLVPMMQVFDAPEPLVSQGSRPSTTIAPQALTFMNSPHVRKYAEGLAGRIGSGKSIEEAVDKGFQIALGRPPNKIERLENAAFVKEQMQSYEKADSKNARAAALADFCQILMSLNEFAYVE